MKERRFYASPGEFIPGSISRWRYLICPQAEKNQKSLESLFFEILPTEWKFSSGFIFEGCGPQLVVRDFLRFYFSF